MAGKGQLKILARSDEEQIYLQFVDNGSGISKEDIAKILMPITQQRLKDTDSA